MPEPSPQHRRYLRSLIELKSALVKPMDSQPIPPVRAPQVRLWAGKHGQRDAEKTLVEPLKRLRKA